MRTFRQAIAVCFCTAGLTVSATSEMLASAAAIRGLAPDEAAEGRPVRMEAVVTFSDMKSTLFVHDGGQGIFVEQPADEGSWPVPGDRVRITGVTGRGLFAPVIRGPGGDPPEIEITGHGPLPEPRPVMAEELAGPELDCDWVTVDAEVREVLMVGEEVVFECQVGPHGFHALMSGPVPPEAVPWGLAESRVRIRGVAATIFNSRRQMTRRFMRINSLGDIVPLEPPPADKPRLVRADELFRISGIGPDELVRIRGTATLVIAGRGLFLRTDGGGLWVQTGQPLDARPGSLVEVVGWPRAGAMQPFLRARRADVIGAGAEPEPVRLEARQILHARHESELISTEAELLDVFHGDEGTTLELRAPGILFRGLLESGDALDFKPGSTLRVTGIAQITSAGAFAPLQEEDKLLIRLRSPEDVEVLSMPPWWTARRVAFASGGMMAGMLGIFAAVRSKRRSEQMAQRREFEAVLSERGRFAREIHDSLAQGLTSISLQLECVRDEVPAAAAKARRHLDNARSLVRDSLREARRTVWNLRPLALGETDLAGALQRFATELTRTGKTTCSQEIEGTPRPLPACHEDALLRIGQEGITNAIRHAGAERIVVLLRFRDDWVSLTVRDDGDGFDVASRVGTGYGLAGMHERVAALGGSLSIDSKAGEGTELSATLPT